MAYKKVVVLGAGVVGVTTAYYLAERGCRVTVLDSAPDVASGASFANGGQLSYSFVDSFAQPSFITKLPRLIRGRDSGSQLRLTAGLLPWGLRYLANCTPKRSTTNMLALLDMAVRSAQLVSEIRAKTAIDFSFRTAGKLVLLGSSEAVQTARATTETKREHGIDVSLLSASEAVAKEPALSSFRTSIKAAIYSEDDQVADPYRFVVGLRNYLERNLGVEFRLNTKANKLICKNDRVVGVQCAETIAADIVVVCLGAWSGGLLRDVGINPHIYPVRGYSVTLPIGDITPRVSVTSMSDRIVFSRLNGSVRIAGFADFTGFSTGADSLRIKALTETARRAAPDAANYDAERQHPWGGFRPMTPSGVPCVGPTEIEGLHVNTGHGMFGWTLACATGEMSARAIVDVR